MGSVVCHGAANAASLAFCSAGKGTLYVVRRASRIALGLWLLSYAASPMSVPPTVVVPRLKALGTAMFRAAMMALVTVAWA